MDDGLPRVFTRAEALRAGMSDKVLRGPQVQRVFRGVYVRREVPLDTRVRTLAALRLAPDGSVAACLTAAELLGGVVPHETRIHLRVPGGQLRVPGVTARVRSGRRLLARIGGVPVTTAEDCRSCRKRHESPRRRGRVGESRWASPVAARVEGRRRSDTMSP